MNARYTPDTQFRTLIVLPARWARAKRLVSSWGTTFRTWDELCQPHSLHGMRFNQIVAVSPPVGEKQSRAWQEAQMRLIDGGEQIEL